MHLEKEQTSKAKVNLPILNLGLPKSASTTLLDFFSCAGLTTSHYHCKMPASPLKPFANASEVSKACMGSDVCRCKVFGNCTHTGLTTEPSASFPLHNPGHYCKTYGLCDADLPKHLRPAGWENVTDREGGQKVA